MLLSDISQGGTAEGYAVPVGGTTTDNIPWPISWGANNPLVCMATPFKGISGNIITLTAWDSYCCKIYFRNTTNGQVSGNALWVAFGS